MAFDLVGLNKVNFFLHCNDRFRHYYCTLITVYSEPDVFSPSNRVESKYEHAIHWLERATGPGPISYEI
jgi:hypothetical protein